MIKDSYLVSGIVGIGLGWAVDKILNGMWARVVRRKQGAPEDRDLRQLLQDSAREVPTRLGIADANVKQDLSTHLSIAAKRLDIQRLKKEVQENGGFILSDLRIDPTTCLYQDVAVVRNCFQETINLLFTQRILSPESALKPLWDVGSAVTVQTLGPKPATATAIADACRQITNSLVGESWTPRHPEQVSRQHETEIVSDFLAGSDETWCVVTGPARSGKTTFLAASCCAADAEGWAVLALNGASLSWSGAAESIVDHMSPRPAEHTWRKILVQPWQYLPEDMRGLLIVIDGVDEQFAAPTMATVLDSFAQALAETELAKIKIVLSCSGAYWNELRRQRPFSRGAFIEDAAVAVTNIVIGEFNDKELKQTLSRLEWHDLVQFMYIDGKPNPPVQAVVAALCHPLIFGLYASLRDPFGAHLSVSWASLVCRFAEQLVQKTHGHLGIQESIIRQAASEVAGIAFELHAQKYRVPRSELAHRLTSLNVARTDPGTSAYAAFLAVGLLVEEGEHSGDPSVRFQFEELGSYFLSIGLEHQLHDLSPTDAKTLLTAWIERALSWPPVLDALFLICARSTEIPPETISLIVQVLAQAQRFRQDLLFSIAPPTVTEHLFALLESGAAMRISGLEEAMQAVQLSNESKSAIISKLFHSDHQVVSVAIRLAAHHRIIDSIPRIIELISSDSEAIQDDSPAERKSFYRSPKEHVREEAFAALAVFGAIATPLIESALSGEIVQERRRRLWHAVQATGYRSNSIVQMLSADINSMANGDSPYLRTLLHSAILLRIPGYGDLAITILHGTNDDAKWHAAKLLTVEPEIERLPQLLKAFDRYSLESRTSPQMNWLARQLAFALVETNDSVAVSHVSDVVAQSIERTGVFSLRDAIDLADKLPLPNLMRNLVFRLADELSLGKDGNTIRHLLFRLSEAWTSQELVILRKSLNELLQRGTDLPQLLTNLLLASKNESGAALSDGHSRRAAIWLIAISDASNSVELLGQLLNALEWPLDQRVADYLRIISDPAAENALLCKLDSWIPDTSDFRRHESDPFYALATCGDVSASRWLVEFLRRVGDKTIDAEMPQGVLVPMIRRGVLSERALVSLASDAGASVSGRIAAIAALGEFNPRGHRELFEQLLEEDQSPAFVRWLIWALGATEDPSVGAIIASQGERWADDEWISAVVAEALARTGYRQSTGLMETLFWRHASSSFSDDIARSLAQLDPSLARRLIFEVDKQTQHPFAVEGLIGALSYAWLERDVRQRILDLIQTPDESFFTNVSKQAAAFGVLVKVEPDLAVTQALDIQQEGRLGIEARKRLASQLDYLVERTSSARDKSPMLIVQLLQDSQVSVAESARSALAYAPTDLVTATLSHPSLNDNSSGLACKAAALGYLDGQRDALRALQRHESAEVRRAADQAVNCARIRGELALFRAQVETATEISLAAFQAFEEHGDLETARFLLRLADSREEISPLVDELLQAISERRKKDIEKMKEIKARAPREALYVSYD